MENTWYIRIISEKSWLLCSRSVYSIVENITEDIKSRMGFLPFYHTYGQSLFANNPQVYDTDSSPGITV